MFTPKEFLNLMAEHSYSVNREEEGKPYNINIIGFRNRLGRPNYFDDHIGIYYESKGNWISECFEATTLPGFPSLLNPVNPKGTAILVPGQYKKTYALGLHKGYEALVQKAPVKVRRDNNKDLVYDIAIEEGIFGINIHRASLMAKIVGLDSAGCQVIKNRDDYNEFIRLCHKYQDFNGTKFTYTLMEI